MLIKIKLILALVFAANSESVNNKMELEPVVSIHATLPELMEAYGYKVDIDTTSYENLDLAINN